MEEKPILDYLPPIRGPLRRYRIASIASVVSATLLSPAAVTTVLLIFGAVARHWLTGYEFDQFIGASAVCNAAGILLDILAIVLGKHHPAALFLVLHILGLVVLPMFNYA